MGDFFMQPDDRKALIMLYHDALYYRRYNSQTKHLPALIKHKGTRRAVSNKPNRELHDLTTLMHYLETTFDGDVANDGTMFDVRASPIQAVEIVSLSFHTSSIGACDVEVYSKSGSHQYFEENRGAWDLILNQNMQCKGPGKETVLDEDMFIEGNNNLRIEKGSERSFYIRSSRKLLYSTTNNFDQVYVEDSHVQILEGSGLDAFFQGFQPSRMWNGRLGYKTDTNSMHVLNQGCSRYIQTESAENENINFGVMFDVSSMKSSGGLTINGFQLFASTSSAVEYKIYTIPSTYLLGKGSMTPWNDAIASGYAEPDKNGMITITPDNGEDFKSVQLGPKDSKGFYISLTTKHLKYHTTSASTGANYIINGDLAIKVGVGVGSYPQKSTFYSGRGFYGRILYISDDDCDLDSEIDYQFTVNYPKTWSVMDIFSEIEFRIKNVWPDLFIKEPIFKRLKNMYNLAFDEVKSIEDNGTLGPCQTSKDGFRCARITSKIVFSHEDGADEDYIQYAVLQYADRLIKSLNLGELECFYAGDEPLETLLKISLSGVPDNLMGKDELALFEKTTKKYLKENAQSEDAKILSVEVTQQKMQDSLSIESRRLDEGSIDITTLITGKHRPPSPGLDFNDLVEESVNSDDSTFKNELIQSTKDQGIEYFSTVEEINAIAMSTYEPTKPPSDGGLAYGDYNVNEQGLGLIANIVIVIAASIFTFGIVFGAFIYRKKRKEEKKYMNKYDYDVESEDEEDVLFVDMLKHKDSRKQVDKEKSKRGPPSSAFNRNKIDQGEESSNIFDDDRMDRMPSYNPENADSGRRINQSTPSLHKTNYDNSVNDGLQGMGNRSDHGSYDDESCSDDYSSDSRKYA